MPGAFLSVFHVGTPLILRITLQGEHNLISLEVSQFLFTISHHWSYKDLFLRLVDSCLLPVSINSYWQRAMPIHFCTVYCCFCDGDWRIHRAKSVHYLATEEGQSNLDCSLQRNSATLVSSFPAFWKFCSTCVSPVLTGPDTLFSRVQTSDLDWK